MTIQDFMIEDISKEIVLLLMQDYNMDMKEALHTLYTSDTYSRLLDTYNGLYTQSTPYIYEYLQTELATGKMG